MVYLCVFHQYLNKQLLYLYTFYTLHFNINTNENQQNAQMLYFLNSIPYSTTTGYAVAQLVEALRYKPEGRRFDSR
jgi:hypothetical protein